LAGVDLRVVKRRLAVLFALAAVAASVKIVGGILFGSKSLLIDALTSMANLAALAATIEYFLKSLRPPDEDHHFGHRRLAYGGIIVTLMAYSFVGGVAIMELIKPHPYRISVGAPIFASIGFAAYLAVILIARRWGSSFLPYSLFTVTELIESGVVIVSSMAGVICSYLVDYIGAWGLTAYIFYELVDIARDTIRKLSDIAPPRTTVERILSIVRETGLQPVRVRLRMVDDSTLHGDIVVRVPEDTDIRVVNRLIAEAEDRVRRELNADVSITVEAEEVAGEGCWEGGGAPHRSLS